MAADCPPHPDLGLDCKREGDHEICLADTPNPLPSYNCTWVRVWKRDGTRFAQGVTHAST